MGYGLATVQPTGFEKKRFLPVVFIAYSLSSNTLVIFFPKKSITPLIGEKKHPSSNKRPCSHRRLEAGFLKK